LPIDADVSIEIERGCGYRYPLEHLLESRVTVKRLPQKITRALIAGALLICLGLASAYLMTRAATHSMNRLTDRLTAKAAEQKQARSLEAERHQQTQLAIRSQQQWEAEQRRQQAEFERERRTAFDVQYVAPSGCENPQSTAAFTECVNHKMRARLAFFDAYAPAESRPTPNITPRTEGAMIKAGD